MTTRFSTLALIGALSMPMGMAVAQEGRGQQGGMEGVDARQQQRDTQNQQRQGQDQRDTKERQQAGSQEKQADRQTQRFLLDDLKMANQNEIEAAKVAQERAKSDRVKQYATEMEADHKNFIQQLDQVTTKLDRGRGDDRAMGANATGAAATDRQGTQQVQGREDANPMLNNQTAPQRADRQGGATGVTDLTTDDVRRQMGAQGQRQDARGQAVGGEQWDANHPYATLRQVHQDLQRRCQTSMRDMLTSKDGAEFDKAYIGSQVMAHQAMLDKLKTYEQYVSADAQQVLNEGEAVTKDHLQKAKQIMDRLAQDQRSASAD